LQSEGALTSANLSPPDVDISDLEAAALTALTARSGDSAPLATLLSEERPLSRASGACGARG